MRIHDISQPLGEDTAVWPGDHAVEIGWSMQRSAGDSVNVALLTTTVHGGTHIDGYLHVSDEGETAAQMPLDAYVGKCTVIDAEGVAVLDARVVDGVDLKAAERVLFRTRAHVDATRFPERFAHIDESLAQRLAEAGVRLVGTDAPSIDPVDSKSLDTHNILMRGRVAILENVVLSDVRPGDYMLVAAPLKLVEADSSPVRALLIEGLL
jgi:arylformamidase